MNGIYIQACLSTDREVGRLPLLIAHKTSFACLLGRQGSLAGSGKKLMSFTANSNTVELDLNKFNLSSGIYTVQVTYENNKTENGRFLYEK
jgi:hypothetical protein